MTETTDALSGLIVVGAELKMLDAVMPRKRAMIPRARPMRFR
jgi:hypothetical protein